jgi:hypothetical protein
MKRRRRPHPQLHLPALEPHEALLLVAICERIITAVWRAHGDAMANLNANSLAPSPPREHADSSSLPLFPHENDLLF